MNLTESKINNYYNILKLEEYLGLQKKLQRYFFEIDKDKNFLKEITYKINEIRTVYNYKIGIFRKKKIKNIHEFAFMRILIYVLIRHFKPKKILDQCILALIKNKNIDSCFAGYEQHKNFWIKKNQYLKRKVNLFQFFFIIFILFIEFYFLINL